MAITDFIEKTNRYLRDASEGPEGMAVDLTVTPSGGVAGQINCGDMVYRTSTGKVASLRTKGSANANTANFVGVANDNYPMFDFRGPLLPPANDPDAISIGVRRNGTFKFKARVGDVFIPGAPVYMDDTTVDAQTVTITSTSMGTSIGTVAMDQRAAGAAGLGAGADVGTSITGAAGVELEIRINAALKV